MSFLLAAAAMGMGVLIPFLVGRTVDDIGSGGGDLTPLARAHRGGGRCCGWCSPWCAGWWPAACRSGVEFDLRNRMYGHLQSLELGFFDSQQTGQLMSRSTVDLQAVRFFLGYGLIFMLQSALTILIAAGVMLAVNPLLALVALAPMPLVIWVAFRYGRRNRPAAQEVQQRIAELTAEAEENVSGVRVVKAFAQEQRQLRRFNQAVRRVFDQSMVSTRLRAFYNPFIGFLPQLGLAAILLVGGRQAINGTITTRRLRRLLRLRGDARPARCGCSASRSAWPSARWPRARGCSRSSTARRASPPPPAPPALPPGGGRVELRDVTFAYDGGAPVLRDVDLDVEAGTHAWRWWAARARARPRSCR